MRIINEIINCEIGYMTIHEKRARILAYIRGKGVAFKDVKSFLEKEAVKEGKVNSPAEIETARTNKVAIPSGRGIRSGPYPEICRNSKVFCSRMRACRQKMRPGRPTGAVNRPRTQVIPS